MPYSFEPSIQNEVFNPDQLIAGDFHLTTGNALISANFNLTRGTLLGQITTSGNFIPCIKTASDGSQAPAAVLAEDINTTSTGTNAATNAPVYLTGEFDSNYMTIDASWTLAQAQAACRDASIFIKTGLSNAIV